MMHTILLAILFCCLIVLGICAISVRNLFEAIILFGAYSYFAVLSYLALSAPDFAFTEAVIGVVSTAYFVTAWKELKKRRPKQHE